jgi:hypothetical protein
VGIIDTLSAGFDRVTRRLWLILIPALVDIAIWTGPRLSISRLSQRAIAALPGVQELGAQYQQSLQMFEDLLTDLGAGVNLLSLLSMRALGLRSLAGLAAPQSVPFTAAPRIIELQTWSELAVTSLALTLLGLLIGCLFLTGIAQDLREEGLTLLTTLQRCGRSWYRLVMLGLAAVVILVLTLLALSFAYTVLAMLSPQIAALGMSLFAIASLWLSAYASIVFFFTVRALFASNNMGMLRSVWSGLNVLHRNFLSALGFLILVYVIQAGLSYIWRELAVNVAGTLVGIMGNAYVSTGLVMASFIFYRDRFVAWQEARRLELIGKGKS